MAKISVIVACYNSESFLSGTIDSVRQQDVDDWELLLVDDGSADKTSEIIQRYSSMDHRIKGFRQDNAGTGSARNLGARNAANESGYLLFLDHDDQLEPQALKVMSVYLDRHADVCLVGCQFQELNEDGHKVGTKKRTRWVPSLLFPRQLKDTEYETPFVTFFCASGQGPFAMHRRSTFVKTTGWETSFWPHEDADMFCQMALLGKVHYLPDRLYLKRVHSGQGMADGARVVEEYEKFRNKWDNMKPRNSEEAAVLTKAKHYYYATYGPIRTF
jgi:glycosyltransferase involved in cell wall biosynthesis